MRFGNALAGADHLGNVWPEAELFECVPGLGTLPAGEHSEPRLPGQCPKQAGLDHQIFIGDAPAEVFPEVDALEEPLDVASGDVPSAAAHQRMGEFPIVVVAALVLERLDFSLRGGLAGKNAGHLSNGSPVRSADVHQDPVQVKDNQQFSGVLFSLCHRS